MDQILFPLIHYLRSNQLYLIMSKFYSFSFILALLTSVSFLAKGQTVTVVSGSPQNPDVVSSFALTLSDPSGFEPDCYNDGYGNYNCYNDYTVTISQGGYNYYSGSTGIAFGSNTISPTMNELQSVPNNSVFNVTVTDSWAGYGGIGGPWSCTNCFRTSNLAVTASGVDPSCNTLGSATANVTGGLAPFTYNWASGGTTQTIDVYSPGTYTVAVTDANSVTVNASVTVGGTATLTVNGIGSDTDDLCVGGTVTASVGSGLPPYTYLWDDPDGSTTNSVSGLAPGTYTVTVTDGNNCVETASATVNYVPTVVVESGSPQNPNTTSFALELSDPTGGSFDYTTDGYFVTTDYGVQITDCDGNVYYNDDIFPNTMPIPWDGTLNLTMDQQIVPPGNTALDVRVREWNSNTYWICSGCFQTLASNDLCADAQAITCGGPNVVASVNNSTTTGAPDCHSTYNGVWYSFVGDGNIAEISTDNAGTDFDTYLAVTESCGGPCVQSDDDGGTGLNSLITFPTVNGQTYYVNVTGWSATQTGTFELSLTCTPPPTPPANDDVCNAIAISTGANGPFSNVAASAEAGEAVPGAGTGSSSCESQDGWCSFELVVDNSIWFQFVAPASGSVTIDTDGSDDDTQLAVYSADNCGDLVTGNGTLLGANDDNPDWQTTEYTSLVNLCGLAPGNLFYIQVDGYQGAEGDVMVNITDNSLSSSFSSASNGLSVAFTDASTSSGTIVSWEWDFGDGNTSTDQNPSHAYGAANTYTVCLTVTDDLGCTSEFCGPVTVDIPTSIVEGIENGMAVYPNPSNGRFVVEVRGVEIDAQLNILDLAGRVVYTEGAVLNGDFRREFNLDVVGGTYLLQIATEEGVVTRKIHVE